MNHYVQAAQRLLGTIVDGEFGQNDLAAVKALLPDVPEPDTAPVTAWPAQSAVAAFYGPAGGAACTSGKVLLPFAFPLAWDDSQQITRFACHAKVAAPLASIFSAAAAHFGEAEFRRLKLDRFGGCYNYRVMRGGTSLSMHAWGIAVDLDPINNQLRWGKDRAAFARPEYNAWWQIVEAHGARSLGRARNMDWQHIQFTQL